MLISTVLLHPRTMVRSEQALLIMRLFSGVEFPRFPKSLGGEDTRLVVTDMSSNFLSRKVDVGKYAVIYGGAQKVGLSHFIIFCRFKSRDPFLHKCTYHHFETYHGTENTDPLSLSEYWNNGRYSGNCPKRYIGNGAVSLFPSRRRCLVTTYYPALANHRKE